MNSGSLSYNKGILLSSFGEVVNQFSDGALVFRVVWVRNVKYQSFGLLVFSSGKSEFFNIEDFAVLEGLLVVVRCFYKGFHYLLDVG